MFVVWKGWGIVVIGIAVLALGAGAGVAGVLGIHGQNGDYPVGLALVVAGVGTWFLGIRMNRNAERHLIDPATGETVVVRGGHDLFFVPVRWWGLAMVVAGVLLVVSGIAGTIQG